MQQQQQQQQMITIESLRSVLERKAADFDNARQRSVDAAKAGIQDLRALMDFVESSITREIEEAFEINRFADALNDLNDYCDVNSTDINSLSTTPGVEKLRELALEDAAPQLGPSKRDFLKAKEVIMSLANWPGKKNSYLPENIKWKVVSSDSVEVVWSKVEGAVCYHVEQRRPSEGAFQRVYEGVETRYRVCGLCAGARVLFRVRSVVGSGCVSEWSECVEASTPAAAPQYLCAQGLSSSEIAVVWDKVDVPCGFNGFNNNNDNNDNNDDNDDNDNNVTPTYHVEMRPRNNINNANGDECGFREIYSGSETRCTASRLESEEEYVFRVRTMAGGRCISMSGAVCGRTSIPRPRKLRVRTDSWDAISLSWDCVVSKSGEAVCYVVEMKEGGGESGGAMDEGEFTEIYRGGRNKIRKSEFRQDTEYSFRVRSVVRGGEMSEWSDVVSIRTQKIPEFSGCAWKECADDINDDRKYSVDGMNPRVASLACSTGCCTIVGDSPIPPNKVTSWGIKVLKSKEEDGHCMLIGVAPFDINQNGSNNSCEYGWYFHCYDSKLYSGPPHNFIGKAYVPWKEEKYLFIERTVGVMMDTVNGGLSFVLRNVNLGVAYEGIPLDKPLIPCVLLEYEDDCVELDLSCVKENVIDTVRVPENVVVGNDVTWDSFTLSWDIVYGASFYQIEFCGRVLNDIIKTNKFYMRGLAANTKYYFRVRTVVDDGVSEWSSVAKGETKQESFEASGWKECPKCVSKERRYSLSDGNPRIATVLSSWCTIIGNTPLPLDKVVSWNVKILELIYVSGNFIYTGVAPSNIDQVATSNHYKCGWYINCCNSTLISGPPHKYKGEEYGTSKKKEGSVHNGDTVGAVMDTAKGELSFVVNGVNYGIAYEGIPLDKPLVPCVVLRAKKISVEFLDVSCFSKKEAPQTTSKKQKRNSSVRIKKID